MSTVPFIFANSVGNISLSELDVNFANVKAYANTAGEVLNSDQHNITQVGTLISLSVTGAVMVGNLFTDGQVSAVNTVTGGSFFTEADLTALGNVVAGNLVSPTAVVNNIRSDDSSVVSVDDGLEVHGALLINGDITANTITANVIANTVTSDDLIGGNVITGKIRADDSSIVTIDDGLEVHGSALINGDINVDNVTATGDVTADNFVSNGNVAMVSAVNRTVWVSSSAPSSGDGDNGDIWFQVP